VNGIADYLDRCRACGERAWHRFAFESGDHVTDTAMNVGSERDWPATRRVISSWSGRSQRLSSRLAEAISNRIFSCRPLR